MVFTPNSLLRPLHPRVLSRLPLPLVLLRRHPRELLGRERHRLLRSPGMDLFCSCSMVRPARSQGRFVFGNLKEVLTPTLRMNERRVLVRFL